MKALDVFIKGENIDLCIPTVEFAEKSDWYSWFNDAKITRFLDQGVFPNTREGQIDFFHSQKEDRLTLIISNRGCYLGVVSLSKVNLIKKTCDVAIVVNGALDKKMSPFISLEAMALITSHAIDKMGICRVEAGQHVLLEGWQKRMELIGYKIEGLHEKKFIKGRELEDTVTIACTQEVYDQLIAKRGKLWDSTEKMRERFKQLPKESFSKQLKSFFEIEKAAYYNKIFNL